MAGQVQAEQTTAVTEEVDRCVRPVLETEGFDLVLAEYKAGVLRLYIDRLGDGAAGVTIDDCTTVSHLVGDLLDAEGVSDQIAGSFSLEVSSPGLDRPLVRPTDFLRFVGHDTRVHTREPLSGCRKFTGRLLEADKAPEGGILLEVDGEQCQIQYVAIHRARLVPNL